MRMLMAALCVVAALRTLPAGAAQSYTTGAPGDADCSGEVTAADALSTMSQVAGLVSLPACGGDADGFDGITVADALAIRRWVAGLPVRPRLVSVSPGSITAAAPLTSFVVRGGLLRNDTVFKWQSAELPVSVVDDGSVAVVEVPQELMVSPGLVVITMVTPGAALASDPLNFIITSPVSCSPTQLQLTGTLTVDKIRELATFTLSEVQNMTGWKLRSVAGEQLFMFPTGYIYNPVYGPVTVQSNEEKAANTQTWLWWALGPRWNNSTKDDGQLLDCNDRVIAEWIDPATPPD